MSLSGWGKKAFSGFFPKHFKQFLRMFWYSVCSWNESNIKIFELRKHMNEWLWESRSVPKGKRDALEDKERKRNSQKTVTVQEMLGTQTASDFDVNDRELLFLYSGVDETE